jgi:hypothetical protein
MERAIATLIFASVLAIVVYLIAKAATAFVASLAAIAN